MATEGCLSCGNNMGAMVNMSGGGACGKMQGGMKGKKLDTETKKILYAKAKKYNVKGRSTMKKGELVNAVRSAQKKIGASIAQKSGNKSKAKAKANT